MCDGQRRGFGSAIRGKTRSPSTVSREVSRNGGWERYRSGDSDDAGWHRSHWPKASLLAERPTLWTEVARKLPEDWSPQQISGWLREMFSDDAQVQLSHETITGVSSSRRAVC